jgi:enoyl-CoA hydratase/carnithine racemase
VLACDVRFASKEKAVFGQPEVGFGLIPGGGALERLPLLVARQSTSETGSA